MKVRTVIQGLKLQEGIDDTEALEEYCLLACSPWLARVLSYMVLDHQPGDLISHNGLRPALPYQSSVKKMPTDLP